MHLTSDYHIGDKPIFCPIDPSCTSSAYKACVLKTEEFLNIETIPNNAFEIENLISRRFLSHLFGDKFIKSTDLEGWFAEDAFLHMISILKDNKDEPSSSYFIKKFEGALSLQGEFRQICNDDPKKRALIRQLASKLLESTENLKVGESFLIPCGTECHFVMYEIIRRTAHTYDFVVYNTGEGIDRHWLLPLSHGNIRAQLAYRMIDIPQTHICQQRVFQDLVELRYQNIMGFVEALYDDILPSLQGTRETLPSDYSQFMNPHESGICTWKALCAYLRYNMPIENYKRLITKARLQVFEKLKAIRYDFNFNVTCRELLYKKLFHKYSCDIETLTKDELIALSLMKLEHSLKKYGHLLSVGERVQAAQTLNYFTQPKNDNFFHSSFLKA